MRALHVKAVSVNYEIKPNSNASENFELPYELPDDPANPPLGLFPQTIKSRDLKLFAH